MHPPTLAAAKTTTGHQTSRSRQTPPSSAAAATDAGHGGAKEAKKRGVQKFLMSAFKRVEHEPGTSSSSTGGGGGGQAVGAQDFSWSSLSSAGGSRGEEQRRAGGDDGSSHDSVVDMGGSKNSKAIAELRNAKIGSSYEAFPWERKMTDLLPVANASRFLSILLLPLAADDSQTRFRSVEDTLARADAWLRSSQRSGVPIARGVAHQDFWRYSIVDSKHGNLGDLADVATMSLYGFEDYHGVDIGVVRAARLWYAPVAGELALEIKLQPGDTRLGFAISRTEEGFIYVSSVADESTPGVASTRSGLLELYRRSRRTSKLLVVARVGSEKVLPWAVSTAGDVRCADTVSLSQRLTLHRQALRPVTLSFLSWDRELTAAALQESAAAARPQAAAEAQGIMLPTQTATNQDEITFDGDGPEIVLRKDSDDCAFRFHNIDLPASWL